MLGVLLEAITRDGETEAQRAVEAARAEATAIRLAADARSAQECENAVATAERELQAVLDARRAGARADARARELQARSRFLERVFAEVEATLPGYLDQTRAGDELERLVTEACAYFPDEPVRIRCRSGLAARLNASRHDVEIVPDESVPEGVIVESVDRRARIDNTLVARLRRQRRALAVDLLSTVRTAP